MNTETEKEPLPSESELPAADSASSGASPAASLPSSAPVLVIGKPNPKQAQAMKARAKHVAYGGARGGGKSWFVRAKAKLLAFRYPGIRILIVRRSYPELIENHIKILREELSAVARYHEKDKELVFPNGSTVRFQYCSHDADLDRLQGTEYDVIFLDEATQLSEYQMKAITACLRGTNSFPKRVYYTCNPGGQGHSYVKRVFLDRRFEPGEDPDDYLFVQALVTDNEALMKAQPDYVRQLEALPKKLRDAWLYGRWDIFEGQFFEEFRDDPAHYADRQFTHVIDPFPIPVDWKFYRSFDWGYNKPYSCGWWAVDPDGIAYRILELYGCTSEPNTGVKQTPPQVFAQIAETERTHPLLKGRQIIGIADPAIWDAETGESIADVAAKHGVYFSPGDHKRIPGWMQLHYRFAFDENGYPMLYVFRNCRAFLRTIPLLRYDERKPEDLDTEGEDHVADETRYFCMARPIRPRLSPQKNEYRSDPRFFALDIAENELIPGRDKPRIEIERTKE